MNIGPVIQSRIRQLLELRGAPAIGAIEAVQPVAVVAGFPQDRQPQLESGDMLIRRFVGSVTVGGVAGEYALAQIRATQDQVLWINRVSITNAAAGIRSFEIGMAVNITALAYGDCHYVDTRLPFQDICPGVVDICRGSVVAYPAMTGGSIYLNVPASSTTRYDVDYVLDLTGPLRGLSVQGVTANQTVVVTFEGVAFDERP